MPARRRVWWWTSLGLAVVGRVAAADAGTVVHAGDDATARSAAALGRGYSLAGGRFAGNCFSTVTASPPSYDFRYLFEAIVADGADHSEVRIVLEFQVYNRSLDEAGSALAPAALALVMRGDLLGFFDACGASYVRSLTRRGRFESTLSYRPTTGGRDPAFEQELESWLRGWNQAGPTPPPGGRDFARRANRAHLAVRSTGTGLGKRAGASLVAGDLDTFRAAAQAAFQSMQADDVGDLDDLEVVRWSDYPPVREALHLARGDGHILFDNSEWLSEHLNGGGAPATACVDALLAGDTLATRPHHELAACREPEAPR